MNRINLFLFVFVGLCLNTPLVLFGQPDDSTKVVYSEETGKLEEQHFLEQFNNNSLSMLDYKTWVKIDISDLFPRFVTPVDELPFATSITLETKLNPKISLNLFTGLYKDRFSLSEAVDSDYTPMAFYLGVEPRYYFKPKQSDQGQILENFNGTYLGLRYQLEYRDENNYAYKELIQNPRPSFLNTFSLGCGIQHRIFEHGFFDFAFGLKYSIGNAPIPFVDENNEIKLRDGFTNSLLPFYRLNLGFALFSNNINKDSDKQSLRTKLFGFQTSEQNMFKINFLDVFKATEYSLVYNKYKLKLDLAFEQKIITPLSVNLNVIGSGTLFLPKKSVRNYPGTERKFTATMETEMGMRYYYNLPRRIAKGKSADNLSANYLTVFGSYKRQEGLENFNNPNGYLVPNVISFATAYGVQRRIFENGYIDYRIGLGYRMTNTQLEKFFFLSELKLGLAF